MVTEFKKDRRYQYGWIKYRCLWTDDEKGVFLQDGYPSALEQRYSDAFRAGCIELPPLPGEYYAGEAVEIQFGPAWLPGVYVMGVSGYRIVDVDNLGRQCVCENEIRRQVSPTTVWRVPTDQDAIDVPRRPCRVKMPSQNWVAAILLAVHHAEDGRTYFAVRCAGEQCVSVHTICEIEVPK